ncbi:MAG TPA: hypothetical protein VKM37_02910 [Balneolaceae bacterium]|nr:hypothetical protein [Balneolaceae bacterium]
MSYEDRRAHNKPLMPGIGDSFVILFMVTEYCSRMMSGLFNSTLHTQWEKSDLERNREKADGPSAESEVGDILPVIYKARLVYGLHQTKKEKVGKDMPLNQLKCNQR